MAARRDVLVGIMLVTACGAAPSPLEGGPPPDDAAAPEVTTLPGCDAGQTRCDGNTVQTCNGAGQWEAPETCPAECCNGACVDTLTDTNNCGACGNACGGGFTCGTSFAAFTGTLPSGWNANGTATYDSANAAGQLTAAVVSQAGTWVYSHELFVDTMTVQFDFFIGGGTGADGMGLMLETNGPAAVGGGGGELGMGGLAGFGVEIDEYDNATCGDSNANHVGIDSLPVCGMNTIDLLTAENAPGFTVADGAWHTVTVDIAGGAFAVTANGAKLITSYAPAGFKPGSYWLGFAGGTGAATNYHRVRNVKVTFPSPHCF